MNKKWIVVIITFLILVFTLFLNSYENSLYHQRYHEHLEKGIKYPDYDYSNIDYDTYKSYEITEDGFTSHLPIISINTHGQEILGGTDKRVKDYIEVTMSFYDEEGTNSLKEPSYKKNALIRYRGNSSRFFDKKGLRIELIDNNGNQEDYPLLGLSSDSDFVLHGPYLDKSLIRNYMGYNITGEVMDYSPNVRFCEVFINGEYEGLYLLVETIKVSNDRVNVTKVEKNSNVSSYLIENDKKWPEESEDKYLNNFTYYTRRMKTSARFRLEYPTTEKLNSSNKEYINTDLNEFEKMLYSYDYDDDEYGYYKYIDVNSFVNYAVFNEFFLNYDAGNYSTYIYKDRNGKFKLAFWDMNNIFNNNFRDQLAEQDFNMVNRMWFEMLMKDEYFTDLMISRYRELRKTILSEEYLYKYIDDTINYLGPTIERNYVRWGYSFSEENDLLVDRSILSYEESIDELKKAIHERGTWLDKNIDSLKQYSHESKVKEMNP